MKVRSVLAMLLAVCMLLATGSMAVAESDKVEIVIWHTFTNDQETALTEIANAFNASQDYATVVVQSQPYTDFLNNVYTAVANGVGPNIIFNYASTASDYVADGLVVDFGKYIDDPEIGIEGFKDSLPTAIYEEACGFSDGKIHCIPVVTTGPILFYNKTLYDELTLTAPTTWEQLAENSKAIYDAKGIPGFAPDSITDITQALIMQNGSGYIDTANNCVLFNNEAAAERIQWFADNVKAGYFTITKTGDYFSNDFNAKLIGSYLGSCAGVPYITPDGFEYDVAPMPMDGNTQWFNAWNRGIIAFTKDEAADKAAYEFAKFFINPENNVKWCKAMISLSPYTTTNDNADYQAFIAENPALAAVSANLQYAGFLPTVSGSYKVRTELEKATTLAASGSMTAAEALAEAETVCNEEMKAGN